MVMRVDCYGKLGEAFTKDAVDLEKTKTGQSRWLLSLPHPTTEGEFVEVPVQHVGRGCFRFSIADRTAAQAVITRLNEIAQASQKLDGAVASAIQRGAKTMASGIRDSVRIAARNAAEDAVVFTLDDEPETEPDAEPTELPETEAVAEPAPEAETEPVVEPTPEPVAQPVAKPGRRRIK